MSANTDQLPTDIAVLQPRLAMALAEQDGVIAERGQALAQDHRLQHLLHQLQRMQFGSRSEKLDPYQLSLAFEDIEEALAATEERPTSGTPAGARERASAPRRTAAIVARFPPFYREYV